jgi:hypothetical protein
MLLTACATSIGTQNTASYFIPNQSKTAVFQNAVQSVVASGMSLASTDLDSGVIVADAGRNPILTFETTKLNVIVSPSGSGSLVSVSAVLTGQALDYGSSAAAISMFCNSFRNYYPNNVAC